MDAIGITVGPTADRVRGSGGTETQTMVLVTEEVTASASVVVMPETTAEATAESESLRSKSLETNSVPSSVHSKTCDSELGAATPMNAGALDRSNKLS